ncbi:hypothetical protein LIER_13198 [Lithospermum erythrorhizon]|uniref:IST1-like protein n=1 Tax=Lithospermum erythrorhizon TaxID=34254 RepID=A0AAV3PUL1_LITER
MGKLDALLRRGFKSKKFQSTVNLAISRLAVLRNQHQSRCSVAMSDVTHNLKQGHHERALLRAEEVVKEQNMLDVFNLIENYFYLLIDRVSLLEHAKGCPEELKEAIASLIYAARRCGEFPELQALRAVFSSRFGKKFADRAAQLRGNCGVSTMIIQKLSTRMHSIKSRMKVLRKIAMEHNIVLQIDEDGSIHLQGKIEADEKKVDQQETKKSTCPEDVKMIDRISDAMKIKGKYKDVVHAAQEAFESAAEAAAAARAAVELSWFESRNSDDQKSPTNSMEQPITKVSGSHGVIKSDPRSNQTNDPRSVRDLNCGDKLEKLNHNEKETLVMRSQSTESEDSKDGSKESVEPSYEEQIRPQDREALFTSSDYDTIDKGRLLLFESHIKNEARSSKTFHNKASYKNRSGDNASKNRKTEAAAKSSYTYYR